MDPWGDEVKTETVVTNFEDNFEPPKEIEKLSDSAEYLAILGKYFTLHLL